ncbi:MAG TPA: TolC family protein [Pyrinomonadaceae bacterium]
MKLAKFLLAGCCAAVFVFALALAGSAQTLALPQRPGTPPAPVASVTPAAMSSSPTSGQIDQSRPISLQTAIDRALNQTTAVTIANFEAQIAAEDVKQARSAFLPKITAPLSIIYTSPSLMNTRPREPSFISADAVTVYQALLSAEGEIDTSGKLRAILQKNIALVDAARAGGEVARRELQQSVVDAYYALALATVKRRGAESNQQSAQEFEENQRLQLEAGEIAPIDLVRARLQTEQRRDELLQARTDETIAADALKILVGVAYTDTIAAEDLLTQLPVPDEIERFSEATISSRPEFAQFEAQKRAADLDVHVARADLLPQVIYQVSSGFITDSLAPVPVKNHSGVQATVGVTIPIFDWGATRSRIAQAKIRSSIADANRQLAERQFILAFYSAREHALAARQRIDLLRQSIADAQNSVTTSIARYRAGEAPLTEVVDAQNTLVTQRAAFYQALFDYQTAKARLARAAGK